MLRHPSNVFLDSEGDAIVAKSTNLKLVENEGYFDYGFIIKIHPKNHPKRTWVCCFGIGEWGSSGTSYYLANRWKEMQKSVGCEQFAFITKTEVGKDDSTTIVGGPFFSEKEIVKFAKSIK